MHIGLVTTEYVTENNFDGGLANYVHRLALSLFKMGHKPTIIIPSTNKSEVLIHKNIEVHRVHIHTINPIYIKILFPGKFRKSYEFLNQSLQINAYIKQIQERNRFSIIHYASLSGLALFRLPDIPSVVRISGYTPLINKAYNDSPGWQQNFWEMFAVRRVNRTFCPSFLISNEIKKREKINTAVIESPFIMDVDKQDDTLFTKLMNGKEYLLFFGTIGTLKGVDLIAENIYDILKNHQNLNFVLIGKQAVELFQSYKMFDYLLLKAGPFKDRVIYIDKIPHEGLYPFIENAHAVILPSRTDNFPNTCIEAMAFRRVVVGTYGTGMEQLINPGINGFLCKPNDPSSLLNAIEEMLSKSIEEREVIGNKALERIKELRPEIVVKQLIDFYQETINSF